LKGTIRYLALEIIALKEKTAPPNTTYNVSANVWGMGLTAYELIHSSRVKFGRISWKVYDEELLPKIATSRIYSINSPRNWASALIREMLHWDPRSRIKAEQAY
jgi:serine/threonine protein kinase